MRRLRRPRVRGRRSSGELALAEQSGATPGWAFLGVALGPATDSQGPVGSETALKTRLPALIEQGEAGKLLVSQHTQLSRQERPGRTRDDEDLHGQAR